MSRISAGRSRKWIALAAVGSMRFKQPGSWDFGIKTDQSCSGIVASSNEAREWPELREFVGFCIEEMC